MPGSHLEDSVHRNTVSYSKCQVLLSKKTRTTCLHETTVDVGISADKTWITYKEPYASL